MFFADVHTAVACAAIGDGAALESLVAGMRERVASGKYAAGGVVPQLAVFGVLLAWLYERTGSLWPPVMLHTLNNAIALVIVTST